MYCGKCEAYIPEHTGIAACLECGAPAQEAKPRRNSDPQPAAAAAGKAPAKLKAAKAAPKPGLSGGIKFNAWLWLLAGVTTIPVNFDPVYFPGIEGTAFLFTQIFLTLLDLSVAIAAIGVLRGKERSRRMMIAVIAVYAFAGAAYMPIGNQVIRNGDFLPESMRQANRTTMVNGYAQLPLDSPVRQQMTEEEFIEYVEGIANKAAMAATIVSWGLAFAYCFYSIWFFRRKKTLAQFR